jgi:hypothetical protein
MADVLDLWVVEHSKRQGQSHIMTLKEVCDSNIRAYVDDTDGDRDYVPLGVFKTHDEASKFMDDIATVRAKKQQGR